MLGAMNVVVRASSDLGSLVTPLRQEIRALDPGLAIQSVTTLKDLVANVMAPTRFALLLISIFAVLALVLGPDRDAPDHALVLHDLVTV